MALEIERKFLLQNDDWRAHILRSKRMRQGYLVSDELNSVRVRVAAVGAAADRAAATRRLSRPAFVCERG